MPNSRVSYIDYLCLVSDVSSGQYYKTKFTAGSRGKSVKHQLFMSSLVPILLLININTVSTQTPVFLVHPNSTAAIDDGTTVEFTCTAENATLALAYTINDTTAALHTNNGFMESPIIETIASNTYRRNLTVTVSSALNNNSEIHCVAVGSDGSTIYSNTATLTVQGPLSSVGDLFDTYIDSSTVNISWSPPFTLPGTHITGYNVSVLTNNRIILNNFTTINYVHYEVVCEESNVTVMPYNGLNGNVAVKTIIPAKIPTPSCKSMPRSTPPTSSSMQESIDENSTSGIDSYHECVLAFIIILTICNIIIIM